MATANGGTFSFQVHDSGDSALDGLFRLIALGDEDRPLEAVLTSMCADVAAIACADVASIYVREDDADGLRFTMRGNVGFPPEAIGRVHLRPGEGITGFAAERMRPVSVAVGKQDRHFKYISGLGEEKYPALLAVPILRGGKTAGVLVLQRGVELAFSDGEVVLATALAAVINHAIERGEARERQIAHSSDRRAVRPAGESIVGGSAMGRAELLPTLSALTGSEVGERAAPGKVESTVDRLQTELRKAAARAGALVVAERVRPFASMHAIASGAVGFVVEGELRPESGTAALVRSAGLPLLASVSGVFSWLRPEDLLVIESGGLRINPPATAIAHLRNARR